MLMSIRTGVVLVGIVGLVAAGPVAGAHERSAAARGACSGDSHWSLRAIDLGRAIGVRYRVVTGVDGDIWKVAIAHNRRLFFLGRRITGDPEGSFVVRRLARDLPGRDLFRARAWNRETGEVCRGRLAI
jgi:hypothetical protein